MTEREFEHRAGERVGARFVLETNLAANTWSALDETTGALVIVRFEATHALAEQRFAALRARYAIAMSAVPEPLACGAGSDPPFVAREYLLGDTLEAQLAAAASQKRAGLGVVAFEQIARGVTTALAALHRGGFAHGGLAPSRIVMLGSVARLLGTDSRRGALERIESLECASARALAGEAPAFADDLWSLGLLTFRALTGRSYWPEVSSRELRLAIANDPVISPTERARERNVFSPLPRGYDDWFRACVTRDASIAYTDGTEALDGLEVLVLRGESPYDVGRPSVCLEIAPPDEWDPALFAIPAAPAKPQTLPMAVPCLSPVRSTAMPCLSVAPPQPKEPSAIEPIEPGQGAGGPYRTRVWRAPEQPRRSRVGCAVLLGVAVTGALLAYWLAR